VRVCYVVQRYGLMIAGGAEQHCREMAQRLAARGHDVEVVTTCAQSYYDWENVFDPGTEVLNGVAVHRFPVKQKRPNALFNEFNRRLTTGRGARPLFAQREWMRMQGPYAPELPRWLDRNVHRFDVVIGFTYLYWPTWIAMTRLAGRVPLVLHPTVHDEPPLRLSIFDELFLAPDAFALSTPEEIDLIERRFHIEPRGEVVGIGVDLTAGDPALFKARYPEIGDTPYLLYVGRIDYGKGAGQLLANFVEYKKRNPDDRVKLAMVGEALIDVPKHPDIVVTGFVDYDVRDSAMAGMLAFALPSYFESFSMVLSEAFAHRRPAIVQRECEVLLGHAQRSGAAFPYGSYLEFEAAVQMLREDPALADTMGAAGRAYVEREYTWDVVMDKYERLLERTATDQLVPQAR
jgi:glycosyltransferase involved in cell wall biosynthesis